MRRLFIQLLCCIGAIAIIALSLFPTEIRLWNFANADKLEHFMAYCVLTVLFLRGANWRVSIISILLFSMGASIEVLQHFTGREASFYDLAANTAGIAAGVMLSQLFKASQLKTNKLLAPGKRIN